MPQVKSIIYAEASRLCQIFCFGLIFYVFVISGLNASPGCEPCENEVYDSSGKLIDCDYVGDGNAPTDPYFAEDSICCDGGTISKEDCCVNGDSYANGDELPNEDFSTSVGGTIPLNRITNKFKKIFKFIPKCSPEVSLGFSDDVRNIKKTCCNGGKKDLKEIKAGFSGDIGLDCEIPAPAPRIPYVIGLDMSIEMKVRVDVELSGKQTCSSTSTEECGESQIKGKINVGGRANVVGGFVFQGTLSGFATFNVSSSKLCYNFDDEEFSFTGGSLSFDSCGGEIELVFISFRKKTMEYIPQFCKS